MGAYSPFVFNVIINKYVLFVILFIAAGLFS